MSQKIDTIIFDLDGTLLDTLTDLTNSVNYALAQYGFPTHSEDEVRQMVGNGVAILMERAIPGGRTFPEFESCLKTFQEHYAIHKKDETKPFPGVMKFLKAAGIGSGRISLLGTLPLLGTMLPSFIKIYEIVGTRKAALATPWGRSFGAAE